MSRIARFQQCAAAFEDAFKSDDWSVVEPYFTEDAVYELFGGEPFDGRHEGRQAILSALKLSLDNFDRRFDSRRLDFIERPVERDGKVWMRFRATYRIGDAELELEGEETAEFEGDRIRRLEDRFAPEASKTTLAFLAEHGEKLGPVGG